MMEIYGNPMPLLSEAWIRLRAVKLELEGKKGPERDKKGKLIVPSTTSPSHHLFFRWDEAGLVWRYGAIGMRHLHFKRPRTYRKDWQMLLPNDDIRWYKMIQDYKSHKWSFLTDFYWEFNTLHIFFCKTDISCLITFDPEIKHETETYCKKTRFEVMELMPMMPQSSFARYPLHNGPCDLFVNFPMAPPSRTEICMIHTLNCEFAQKTSKNVKTCHILGCWGCAGCP